MSPLFKTLTKVRPFLPHICILSWWRFGQQCPSSIRKCRSIIRLLLECHQLKSCKFKYKNEGIHDPFCEYCDDRAVEDVEHVLFVCKENTEHRDKLWKRIVATCPNTLIQDMILMPVPIRTAFLLSGLGNSYVPEWKSLFIEVANYIHDLYSKRLY